MKNIIILIWVVASSLVSCSAEDVPPTTLGEGNWGGSGVNMVVTANKTTIEMSCGRVEITESILVTSTNTLSQNGVYFATPGIVPVDYNPENYKQDIKISGKKEGNVLFLQIEFLKDNRQSEILTLNFNKVETVTKCL